MEKTAFDYFRARLGRNETLLWCGRPSSSAEWRAFRTSYRILLLLMPLWYLAFLWVAVGPATMSGISPALRFLGIIFGLVGSLSLINLTRLRRRSRAVMYALTDRRVLIAGHPRSPGLFSVPLGEIENVRCVEHTNGLGTIWCARKCFPWIKNVTKPGSPALYVSISDVQVVCDLLLDAQRAYVAEGKAKLWQFSPGS